MATRTEGLVVKLSSDGGGNVRAEMAGVAAGVKGVGDASKLADQALINMGSALRNIAIGGGVVGAITTITNSIKAIGGAALSAEQSEARLNGIMRATGATARTSAAEIEGLVQALSVRTGLGDDEIRNAAAQLLVFKNIQGDLFREALGLGADWAATFGGDMAGGVEKVARALQEPFNGVRLLARELGGLDAAQESTLKGFELLNDVAGATRFNLNLIRTAVQGVKEEMHSGLRGDIDDTANAWDKFLEGLGRTTIFQAYASHALTTLRDELKFFTSEATSAAEPRGLVSSGSIRRPAGLSDDKGKDAAELAQNKIQDALRAAAQADAENRVADALKKVNTETVRATDALKIKNNVYDASQEATARYRVLLGDLAGASTKVKAAYIAEAKAADDKLQLDRELAQNDIQATQRALARADAENRTAEALQASAAADRERAKGLAARGDPRGTASKNLNADQFAVESAFQSGDLNPTERLAALQQAQQDFIDATKGQTIEWSDAWSSAGNRFAAGMGDAVATALTEQRGFAAAIESLAQGAIHQIISGLVEIGIKRIALSAIEESAKAAETTVSIAALTAQTTASVIAAGVTAAAWAPAAAAVSLASFGSNAAAASAGIAETYALTNALSVIGQAHDGLDYVPRTGTYVLEEGERVIKKDQNRDLNNALKGGGGQGVNVTFAISAIDGASVERMLKQRAGTISRIAINAVQRAYKSTMRAGPLG